MLRYRFSRYKNDYWFDKLIRKEYGWTFNREYYQSKIRRRNSLNIGISLEKDFKHKCNLCDFYTNEEFLFERHLNSNNHFIRKNQF